MGYKKIAVYHDEFQASIIFLGFSSDTFSSDFPKRMQF
jgi:hypothetical protein